MLEKIIVALAIKLLEKLLAFVAKKVMDFNDYLADQSELKKAIRKAKEGDNSDLEDLLNTPPA